MLFGFPGYFFQLRGTGYIANIYRISIRIHYLVVFAITVRHIRRSRGSYVQRRVLRGNAVFIDGYIFPGFRYKLAISYRKAIAIVNADDFIINGNTVAIRIRLAAAELVVHAVNGQSCQRITRGFSSCAFDFRAGVYLEGTLIIGKLNLDIFACLANASNSNCTINIQPPKSCKANGTATASLGNLYFFNVVFMKRY